MPTRNFVRLNFLPLTIWLFLYKITSYSVGCVCVEIAYTSRPFAVFGCISVNFEAS